MSDDFFNFKTEPVKEKDTSRILWGFVFFICIAACVFMAIAETAFFLDVIK